MNVAGFVQILATIAWLGFIGVIVFAVVQASRGRGFKSVTLFLLIFLILAVVLTTTSAGMVFIQPDQRGVVISAVAPKGYRDQPLQPGLRWVIPFVENVVLYPISRQTYTMSIAPAEGQVTGDDSISARTSDGQEVLVDASVIYAIDPNKVTEIHIRWQNRYTADLVRPVARGVIRDVVSQFKVEEVYSSRRLDLTNQIMEAMTAKLDENGLILSDFVLRNITFSPEYAASVEQKQIAEQQAQQAKFVVETKIQEAQQAIETAKGAAESIKIKAGGDASALVINATAQAESRMIQAKAEADALKLIAEALRNNPDLLTYQYISKLAPGIQVMLVPNNAPYLLPLPNLNSAPNGTTTPTPY